MKRERISRGRNFSLEIKKGGDGENGEEESEKESHKEESQKESRQEESQKEKEKMTKGVLQMSACRESGVYL